MYEKLKQQILAENSRRNVDLIAGTIGDDPDLFSCLIRMMLTEQEPYNVKAAWVITAVTDSYPWLLDSHLDKIIPFLKKKQPDGIIRCMVRQLSKITLPEKHMGVVFDLCFSWAENPKYALAIRANAMSVVYEISNTHKDLKPELIVLFEQIGEEEAPAMISRSRLLLKKLNKEIR